MTRLGWRRRLSATPVLTAALLGLAAAGSGPAAWAQAPAGEAGEERAEESRAEEERKGEEERDGKTVIRDEVFVSGRRPEIPTSSTVATKLPLALAETPASVAVVSGELLEEQDAFLLGDALENVSGMNVHRGSGIFDFFVVRGLDSISSGRLLTDGAPEPESTSYPLYNVDRVEVLKGPSSFLYGGGPLGATVNLVRKQPLAADFVRVGASAGSFATYETSADANFADPSGRLAFRVNALWQGSDGFRDGKESDHLAVNPAFTWRPDERTSVHVSFEAGDLDYQPDSGLPVLPAGALPEVPRRRSYQSPFDLSEQEVLRFQVDVESRRSERFVLRNKSYYRRLDWLSRGTVFNGVFPSPQGGLLLARSLLSLDDRQTFAGNQLEGLWRLGPAAGGEGVTHHLLVGLEAARLADEFTFDVGLLPVIDLFTPVETAREPVPSLPGQAFGADARSVVVAPYAVDQITFSGKVQLLVGARYDHIDFEDERSGASRSDGQVSPMAGLVVTPTPSLTLYASAGEAFAPPSTFVAGEEREPEESRQLELGVKKGLAGGRLQASLALFRIDREKIAIPDATGVLQQTGDQRAQGVELEISAQPAPGFQASLAYAYTDAELTNFTEQVLAGFDPPRFVTVDRSGNTPAFTPEQIVNLWLSRRLPHGLTLGVGARHVSEQLIDEDNAFAIDAYTLLGAALSYTRGPWRLHLTLENLTEEEYLTRGFGGNSVIPAPGRAAYAGFRYGF